MVEQFISSAIVRAAQSEQQYGAGRDWAVLTPRILPPAGNLGSPVSFHMGLLGIRAAVLQAGDQMHLKRKLTKSSPPHQPGL